MTGVLVLVCAAAATTRSCCDEKNRPEYVHLAQAPRCGTVFNISNIMPSRWSWLIHVSGVGNIAENITNTLGCVLAMDDCEP